MTSRAKPLYSNEEIQEFVATYGPTCTYAEACAITGLSRATIERLAARGELKRYRPGRARVYRYRTTEVARLLKAEA